MSTCVGLRYGFSAINAEELFSAAWHRPIRPARERNVPSRLGLYDRRIYLSGHPTRLGCHFQPAAGPASCVPPLAPAGKYRNINLLSINYAFRPRLRIRLTLGGRTLPRKPWTFGEEDSHLLYRYSCLHGHSGALQTSFRPSFAAAPDALLPLRLRGIRGFGTGLSPDYFRRRITRPVSYYALFK